MKKIILLSLLAGVSSVSLTAEAQIHPLEICSVGNSCVYNVSGHSQRIITTSDLKPHKVYVCRVGSDNGKHFTVGFVSSSSDARIKEGQSHDLTSPFMLFGPTKGTASVTYSLRNNDLWGMEHTIHYTCSAEN